jgi:hypothetical protein
MYRISNRRNPVTGRSRLELRPLHAQPKAGGDILAISEAEAPRILPLVGPASTTASDRL